MSMIARTDKATCGRKQQPIETPIRIVSAVRNEEVPKIAIHMKPIKKFG